jgi:hypothetical protein
MEKVLRYLWQVIAITLKKDVSQLALDKSIDSSTDFGKCGKVELLEKLALSWINLAIMQGHVCNMAFKSVKRKFNKMTVQFY